MSETITNEAIEKCLDIVFDIAYDDGPGPSSTGWAEAAIGCGVPRAKVEEVLERAFRAPPFLTKDMAIGKLRHDVILLGPSHPSVKRYKRYAEQRGATPVEIASALDLTR